MSQLEKTRAELEELRTSKGGTRNTRPSSSTKPAASLKKDPQKEVVQNPAPPQKGSKVPKELDVAAITTCANLFNVDALRKTKKRSFDEIAAILAENISVATMRQ